MAIGLDVGSSSIKAIRIDGSGRVRAAARRPIRTRRADGGRVEHDPADLLKAAIGALNAAARGAAADEPIGIATQRSTFLFWERDSGRPLTPAYSWQDLRGRAWCERARRDRRMRAAAGGTVERFVAARTGLRFSPHYAVSKIAWALAHVRGLDRRVASGQALWGGLATWIVWHLSRGALYILDHTNAQRTLLMNLETLGWDPALGDLFRLGALFDAPLLPALVPAVHGAGFPVETTGTSRRRLRLRSLIGDQQAAVAALDDRCRHDTIINYGSGAFVLRSSGPVPARVPGLLTSILSSWRDPGGPVRCRYAVEGTVNAAAVAIDWAQRRLGLRVRTRDLDRYLGPAAPGPRPVHFLPAVAGVAAPRWDERARPRFAGARRRVTDRERLRAVVESIACRCAEILKAAAPLAAAERRARGWNDGDARHPSSPVLAAGGLTRCRTLLQAQADLLGRPVIVRDLADATALGAARLAAGGARAAGAGRAPGGSHARETTTTIRPRLAAEERDARYRDWERSVYGPKTDR